ncbi:MAG TPA: hypothetical protein VG961_04140 [Ignavibacteria bacterium]|nr:hypothetical protein [Ignavibacteria bacterium]
MNENEFIVLCETYDYMESELIEALLTDSGIEFHTRNKADTSSGELGTRIMERISTGIPIIIYVKAGDEAKAYELLNEDRSHLLDDENLDFGKNEDELDAENDEENI